MDKKKTEECYVASLDLLGAKNMILNDDADTHLNHIYNIYKSWERIRNVDGYFGKLKVKIFSDNILIACNVEDGNLEKLLEYVADMAEHFLKNGYKIRGGISKGRLYIDDLMVWGSGLVNAYILESKCAIYPRIILNAELLGKITNRTKDELIVLDSDGYYYMNYIRWYGKNKAGYLDSIHKAKEHLAKEYENVTDEKVKEKLDWFKKYLESEEYYWMSR